jgi:hypothetical protein
VVVVERPIHATHMSSMMTESMARQWSNGGEVFNVNAIVDIAASGEGKVDSEAPFPDHFLGIPSSNLPTTLKRRFSYSWASLGGKARRPP